MLLNNTHIEDIISTVHCSRPSCPNQNNYCNELDEVHLKVMPSHMKTWSMSINEGNAPLEASPNNPIATLMPSKAGTYNSLRGGPHTKATKSISSLETTFSHTTTPFSTMPLCSGHPTFSQYFYNVYTLSPTQMHHLLLPVPNSLAYQIQFSDSIADEQDLPEKLIAYFTWLVEKSPLQFDALMIAKKTLIDKGHTFKTLKKLSQVKLENARIQEGMAMQLLSYIDLFKIKTVNHS